MKTFQEFINESENSALLFYIDMDGVLADFDKSLENSDTGEQWLTGNEKIKKWMKENKPDFKWKLVNDIKALSQENPELLKLYDDIKSSVMKTATKEGFFRNLEMLDGAKKILSTAIKVSGRLPHILTACVESSHCEPEKIEWMKEKFDGMYDKIFCEQDKGKYATNKNDVLVDDRITNIKEFVKAGGSGIYHDKNNVNKTIEKMKKF
jgi:5'(3')-deoxyribonucleotidase